MTLTQPEPLVMDHYLPEEQEDRHVAVEWSADDQPENIAVEHFDFSSLDTLDDQLRQELEERGTTRRVIDALLSFQRDEARREGIVMVIALLWPKKKAYLALRQLAFAAGLSILAGKTGPELAKECGVSKQDFKQGADRFRKELGLRRTRTMRSIQGCEKMQLTNFRHETHDEE
jgi:hypothetical protein